jgi:hypothetical protein
MRGVGLGGCWQRGGPESFRKARPGIKTYAIPHGLQVEKGPDAIVEHLVENVPKLLEQ